MNNYLKRLREELGLTQQEMADKIGVHRVKYTKIELGYQKPDLEFVAALSKAFDLDAETIYQAFLRPEGSISEPPAKEANPDA